MKKKKSKPPDDIKKRCNINLMLFAIRNRFKVSIEEDHKDDKKGFV
jgi:hypothetical protein